MAFIPWGPDEGPGALRHVTDPKRYRGRLLILIAVEADGGIGAEFAGAGFDVLHELLAARLDLHLAAPVGDGGPLGIPRHQVVLAGADPVAVVVVAELVLLQLED